MVDAVFRSKETGRSLFTALLDARDAYGARTIIAEDVARVPIGYDRVVVGSAALGRALAGIAAGETHVALLMPNAIASVVAFMGLQAFGVVPCLLNISAGAAAMLSACRTAGVRTVISSRAFVEKGRLTKIVERMAEDVRFVWLEDVRASIGLRAKLRARRDAWRRAPSAGCVHGSGCTGGGAVHQRIGGRSERRGAEPSQPARQLRADRLGDRLPWRRHRVQRDADVPRLRPDRRHDPAAGVRRAHVPLPDAAALPDRAGADLRHRCDDLLRHRHVPERLGALCPSVRLPRHALHLRRRGEGAGGDQASVRRPLRRARPGRLWRHRNVAGARTEHGDAVPSRHGGPLHARDRLAARAGCRHRDRRPAARARSERDAGLSARDRARCGGTAGGRLVRHRRHRVGGWRGVRHHRRPGEAVRQDRRRDGVDGGCRSAGCIAVAGGAARGDQPARSAQGRIAAAGDNAAGRGQPGDPCGRESADDSRDHGAARGAVRAVGSAAGHRQDRLSRRCSVWPKTHVPARRRKLFPRPELPSHSDSSLISGLSSPVARGRLPNGARSARSAPDRGSPSRAPARGPR